MDPVVIEALAPLMGMLIAAVVVSIPLLGLSARFAAKPLIEAFARFEQAQALSQSTDQTLLLQDRRLSLLEAELQSVQATLQQLVEAEEFRRQLEDTSAARALPRSSGRIG